MTLPDSEKLRIKERYPDSENIDRDLLRLKLMDAAIEEAQLWYERMGKFAEWVRGEGFQYLGGIWSSYKYNRSFTTPELINEFLKIK